MITSKKMKPIFSSIILLLVMDPCDADDVTTRLMYDSMARLVGDTDGYPESWWMERQECFNTISPTLIDTLDLAWQGMIQYWEMGGQRGDFWYKCDEFRWFENNCTMQPGVEMAIWEPCNYVSNLAYDRLVLELCRQDGWTLGQMDVRRIAEAFAIVTFGSGFFHGSETCLGKIQDTKSNDLFIYILHQASMINIPYDPILHDLSLTPRVMSAPEIVEYWLDMFDTKPVTQWNAAFEIVDIPGIQKQFSAVFGKILLLEFGYNGTITIATPLMDLLGVGQEDREFIFDLYLPLLDEHIGHIDLTLEESAELLENTIGTVIKLLYGFFWQESIIDLTGINDTPEINEAGASFTPRVNMFANNLTRWDLHVEDVQLGGGYPGSEGCNNVIPHAKWHAQTAAALSDMTRLMDFVLELENRHPAAPDTRTSSTAVKNKQNLASLEGYLNLITPTMHKIIETLPKVNKKLDPRTRTCCAEGPGC